MSGIRSTRDNAMRQQQDAATAAVATPTATAAWASLAAIGCVALAAFAIAATIVLALIPLYLPTKSINIKQTSTSATNTTTNSTTTPRTFTAVWTMRWVNATPDGVTRPILMINNQYPGPKITVQQGDTVNITFINEADEQITIHWHGMLQRQTTNMDGVPGVTQCPILPGQNFTYTFSTTNQRGTFWYHSHDGVQLGDGLQGPLIVLDPNDPWINSYSDDDLLLMTEWYHTPGYIVLREFLRNFITDPVPDTGLVNAIGQYDCNPTTTCSYYRTFMRPNTTKRFRFINTSIFSKITVTIDQHVMRVIEADGITLDGSKITRSLRFNPAQRYSVLVTALANPAPSYWIRVTLHAYVLDVGFYTNAVNPNVSAILQYITNNNTNVPIIIPSLSTFNNDAPIIQQSFLDGEVYADETGLFPMPNVNNQVFPTGPSKVVLFNLTADFLASGGLLLLFNNVTFTHPGQQSLLASLIANNQAALFSTTLEVPIERGDIIDLVINNLDILPHPMHLHGHEKWLLSAGSYNGGYFGPTSNATIVSQYNTVNPIVRDVITINPFTYIVMRFIANNPGIWIMHCHNDWHLNIGMAMVFVEAQAELRSFFLNRSSTIHIPTTCAAH